MRIYRRQPMAIPNEKGTKCKIELNWRIENVTKWRSYGKKIAGWHITLFIQIFDPLALTEHANAMEWHDSGRRTFVLLRFGRIDKIRLNHLIYFDVTREAQHYLIENIFKDKVLIIIGGSQLNIFEYELVNDEIRYQNMTFQFFPILGVLNESEIILNEKETFA